MNSAQLYTGDKDLCPLPINELFQFLPVSMHPLLTPISDELYSVYRLRYFAIPNTFFQVNKKKFNAFENYNYF